MSARSLLSIVDARTLATRGSEEAPHRVARLRRSSPAYVDGFGRVRP